MLCTRKVFITLCILNICQLCSMKVIHAMEGDEVQLDFPFPCDCSEITLQNGNGIPFYSSGDPDSKPLSANKILKYHGQREYGNCTISLTFTTVSRTDIGTYILTAYKDGKMLPEYPRIYLDVKYPPGKASCELSNDYDDGVWVSLLCTAQKGTFQGEILCYQDGLRQPHWSKPERNGQTFNQIMLVRLTGFVYCCSSRKKHTKNMCECKDWHWDPMKQSSMTDISDSDPCHAIQSTSSISHNLITNYSKINSNFTGLFTSDTPVKRLDINAKTSDFSNSLVGAFVFLVVFLSLLVISLKVHHRSLKKIITAQLNSIQLPLEKFDQIFENITKKEKGNGLRENSEVHVQ